MLRTFLFFAMVSCCSAQTLQVSAGSGSLYRASGIGVTAFLPNSQVYAGGGCAADRCAIGFSDTFRFHGYTATAGDSTFGGMIDGSGTGVNVRGLQLLRTSSDNLNVTGAFVGASSIGAGAPFFSTLIPQHISFGFLVKRRIGRWGFSTVDLLNGSKKTALGSASFNGSRLHGYVTGGTLNNQPLFNASVDYRLLGDHLSVSAGHNNYFFPQGKTTADNATLFGSMGHVFGNATVMHSVNSLHTYTGAGLTGGIALGPTMTQASYYTQKQGNLFTCFSTQRLNRRFSINETYSHTHSSNFSIGGSYTSNRLTVSVGRSVSFLPFNGGFQNVMTASISIRIPYTDAKVIVDAMQLPNHHVLYSGAGSEWTHGPFNLQANGPRESHSHSGKYEHTGKVTNRKGEPVAGAAVMLGKDVVFSGDDGQFFARSKKQRVDVRVVLDEFAAAGAWHVVACPETSDSNASITVVVDMN